MAEETFTFQAEVSKLLDIVAHSLYSNKEVFLRELISNASDACDRLRYAAITEPALIAGDSGFKIALTPDAQAKTLTIADNGIGMDRTELIDNLGTIARSGTAAFVERLAADRRAEVAQIGQFGVGFYSAFMVADKVTVLTCKAGEGSGWRWESDGKGAFTVEAAADASRGTRIILHLREGEEEFLEAARLRQVVKSYSDHIGLPVVLADGDKEETLNAASALWTRARAEVTPEQYKEFYHHVAHAFDDPWLTIHYRAEGAIEYTGLLFVPTSKPFDLFHQDRKHHVKLYVRRVFITGDAEGLVPPYLRFLRGVVDSEDLPLNISREMLQHNPVLAKIKAGLVRRVLGDLKAKAADAESYAEFWSTFGAVLKEGLYEDFERRNDILDLCRFRSTAGPGLVSLADYVGRMKEGQEAIYYITGDDPAALTRSPHLEGFAAKGVEVLLLTDPIDEFWPNAVPDYQGRKLVSAAHAGADLGKVKAEARDEETPRPEAAAPAAIDGLIAALKTVYAAEVKDVRASERLTESAVCLVADQNDMSAHLERLLRQHRQIDAPIARVLEVNPRHALIKRLAALAAADATGAGFADAARLLLDQARIIDGEPLPDPAAFARRLAATMERGLAG